VVESRKPKIADAAPEPSAAFPRTPGDKLEKRMIDEISAAEKILIGLPQ